jgi:hypothetical protein
MLLRLPRTVPAVCLTATGLLLAGAFVSAVLIKASKAALPAAGDTLAPVG